MGKTLGILFTFTTYGTWLRGDQRGWIEKGGKLMPPLPWLEKNDQSRMKHEPFLFELEHLDMLEDEIAVSLITRKRVVVLAMHVAQWHTHFVIGATRHAVGVISKCAKDAARYALRAGRPIWTDGYDKRFCFDEKSLRHRVRYVERHHGQHGRKLREQPYITPVDEYLRQLELPPVINI
ncbi:MAG: hypothetical protein KDA37_08870 [Planctomycetales bacterium]|nr:hypothetical protein [Planctomycetales bacterium]